MWILRNGSLVPEQVLDSISAGIRDQIVSAGGNVSFAESTAGQYRASTGLEVSYQGKRIEYRVGGFEGLVSIRLTAPGGQEESPYLYINIVEYEDK